MIKNITVRFKILFGVVIMYGCINASNEVSKFNVPSQLDRKVDSVLSLMTLEEKVGQMCQVVGVGELTGPITKQHGYIDAVRNGLIGSMLNINGAEYTRRLQEITLTETRLAIPLLFGYDIIHGYKTIFPIPLAEACSWDLQVIEKSARIAAVESSAAGQHWTFAPMVDIARDPRWGRIAEGAGEDTYLGCLIAKARVKGFQGEDLADPSTIAACAKHFAAYGAAEGGRDYNTTDMSYRTLAEVYLPPFKAAIDAGVATFMFAFNDLNGVPASSNEMLAKILRNDWKYNGMVVSDWGSIRELIPHGIAKDKSEAAVLGMKATIDMDMEGYVYSEYLVNLVKEGKISEKQVDGAVRNILRLKFQLGLFDDPYRYCDEKREKQLLLCPEHRKIARETAKRSLVLLKNKNNLLPIQPGVKSIALIGPLADNKTDVLGCWRGMGDSLDAVSLYEGIGNRNLGKTKILYSKGCQITGEDKSGFAAAVKTAKKAEIVILAMGESSEMSGEAYCRSFLGLPGVQLDLIREIKKTGKPIILVLMNGRPLAIPWESENADCILETWFAGTEAGNAIADVLFGDYNPSGKLVASFPYSTGQIPVYYNHKNTGRPADPDKRYTSKYIDAPIECLYPFGFGLSYTKFEYSGLKISKTEMDQNDTSVVSVTVKNYGQFDGEEVVQFYIQDIIGSVTRPVTELKGFEKIFLKAGEEKQVSFKISKEVLSFYDINMNYITETGDFKIRIGTNSQEYLETGFKLVN